MVTSQLLAVEGLVKDEPVAAIALGLGLLVLAWLWWVFFPRHETVLRRIPGAYGRLPNAMFLAVMGGLTILLAVVLALS